MTSMAAVAFRRALLNAAAVGAMASGAACTTPSIAIRSCTPVSALLVMNGLSSDRAWVSQARLEQQAPSRRLLRAGHACVHATETRPVRHRSAQSHTHVRSLPVSAGALRRRLCPSVYSQRSGFPVACTQPPTSSDLPEHLRVIEDFTDDAEDLRAAFDENFEDPRQAHPMRFVWDYWHVPEQYTLHRTMAADYFEEDAFDRLTAALTDYGQRALGCRAISPPWLSYYVDGCEQALHADVPQGPFAYVLSLTRWDERAFSGGETVIMQPQVLDYWRGFDSSSGLEFSDLLTSVPARFNQLTVFDARLPHGVRRVEGMRDPRRGRLVLHGWFTEPEPHFEGALDEDGVMDALGPALVRVGEAIGTPCVTGLLSVRVVVGASGGVERLERMVSTLVADPALLPSGTSAADARLALLSAVESELNNAEFEPSDGETQITIPFVFD